MILVLLENNRRRDVEVAIELLGARGKVAAEPQRTASVLLDAGVLKEGAGAATLTAECAGSSVRQEIATECASSWTLTTRITDDGVDVKTPARIYLEDEVGAVWPKGATVRKDEHGKAFFHADGGSPPGRTSPELRRRVRSHVRIRSSGAGCTLRTAV